jgi:hypothetical protein
MSMTYSPAGRMTSAQFSPTPYGKNALRRTAAGDEPASENRVGQALNDLAP